VIVCVNELAFPVVTQFDHKDARSVPESTGRFTVNAHRERNGRPFFGLAAVCSIQYQPESPPRSHTNVLNLLDSAMRLACGPSHG
jgi:hypothetical protein